MKRLVLAAAVCIAAPAHAQTDELCASLDKALGAAKGAPLPFGALAKEGKTPVNAEGKHPSFYSVDKPPGLADAKACRVDNAGSVYGSATGKATDRFECELFSADEEEDKQGAVNAKAAGEAMVARIRACLTPKGWKAEAPVSQGGGRERNLVWSFTHASQKPVVQVSFETFVYGRQKYVEQYDVKLRVIREVPNKAPTKPATPAAKPTPPTPPKPPAPATPN